MFKASTETHSVAEASPLATGSPTHHCSTLNAPTKIPGSVLVNSSNFYENSSDQPEAISNPVDPQNMRARNELTHKSSAISAAQESTVNPSQRAPKYGYHVSPSLSSHPLVGDRPDPLRETGFQRGERQRLKQENSRLFLRIADVKSDLNKQTLLKGAEKSTTMKSKLSQMAKNGHKTFGEKMLEKLEAEHRSKKELTLKKLKMGVTFKTVSKVADSR